MKIAQLLIQAQGPLRDFQIDLTYPEGHPRAGQALDRACFIGPNGVGKSTLMRILVDYLRNTMRYKSKGLFLVKLEMADRSIYSVHINNNALLFHASIDEEPTWMFELIRDQSFTMAFNRNYERHCIGHEEEPALYDELWFDNNGDDLVVHLLADYGRDRTIGLTDAPPTKSHDAESLLETFPLYGEISPEKTTEFWAMLIFLMHRREQRYRAFAEHPAQRGMAEAQVKSEFAKQEPEVLPSLAALWAPLLDPLGLKLDVENAVWHGNIKDKLALFIVQKANGQRIEYGELGTGLRRLLFQLGYVWTLHFGRMIHHGFFVLEEPESGLYPKLVSEIIPSYQTISQHSQMFVSTHHPLVAAAFDPAERFILSRDARGQVMVRRSDCPADADLATILARDFA